MAWSGRSAARQAAATRVLVEDHAWRERCVLVREKLDRHRLARFDEAPMTFSTALNLRTRGAVASQRLRPRAQSVMLATFAGFLAGVSACTSDVTDPPITIQPITSELELRDSMRTLWVDHVVWTRVYLVSALDGLPGTDAAAARLLQNQDDIGRAIAPFYGAAAGDALAALLREHITIAVEIVTAARASDPPTLEDAMRRWSVNADAIATFLAGANPNWSEADLKAMMRTHLDQTLVEATARLDGDFAADIEAYDAIVDHILHMADTLSAGIATQFPDKVSSSASMRVRDQDLHRAMRDLWSDHVVWTRMYLVSAIVELPDTDFVAARLLQNQVDIGAAIEPFYGAAAGDALTVLLQEHIGIAVEIVAAAKGGDAAAVGAARLRWNINADAIATFLADANPNWDVGALRSMMYLHLEQTLAEASARVAGDFDADVAAYDEIVEHINHMADALSAGISAQFPQPVASAP